MPSPSFKMVAAGDVMLGDSSHFLGRGVASRIRRYGPSFPFEDVAQHIQTSDLFFANLESPLAYSVGKKSWDQVYRGEAKAVEGLKLADQNVVSVANNHVREHGQDILAETHSILSDHGIGCAGYGAIDAEKTIAWEGCINGLTISLFAISLIKDFFGVGFEPEKIENDLMVRLAGCNSDVKIVSVHWGNEYVNTPSQEQISLGHRLIDAGVALVVGHHPHVLQPVEEYSGGIIAYSLGNFVFDQDWGLQTRGAGMLEISLSEEGVLDWDFIPTIVHAGCRPRLATGKVAEELLTLVSGEVGLSEAVYRKLVAENTKKFRIRMKLELLRNFWRVSFATVHFLLTKRNRPKPGLSLIARC